ncbi:MAG: sugar transferase, partial [Bacteroidota bacterium]
NGGSPFFTQSRPGLNEKVFRLIKLKSMNDKKDAEGNLLPDEVRLTKTGNFLRKTSLDEIPQLLNVIKGDMSLVGPRPLRVHYLPYYTEREAIRHTVRPGITGLAQVSGRNSVDWDEKLELDAQYVDQLSFAFDFKILLKTFVKIFKSSEVILDDTNMVTFDEHRKKQNEATK